MRADADGRDVFAGLRRFVRPRKAAEVRCELCAASVGADHPHLLDAATRKVLCSCDACALLFSGKASTRYRCIPREIRALPGFVMAGPQWEALSIPVNIAFFTYLTKDASQPTAFYPSPAGATESLLSMASWEEIMRHNPELRLMEREVEALLVNRIAAPHEYYIVPIDDCYKLVGLIRTKWRGLSGGSEAWQAIGTFFASLKSRAVPARKHTHA